MPGKRHGHDVSDPILFLADEIALARERGLPVVLTVDRPLEAASQRLMAFLGVAVVVDEGGRFVPPAPTDVKRARCHALCKRTPGLCHPGECKGKPVSETLTGVPTYCPHKGCPWSFTGSKARAAGYLDTHIRIVHKGDDPREKATARLVAEAEERRKVRPVEEPPAPAPGLVRGNGNGEVEEPAPTGGSVEATVGVDGTTNSGSRKRWPRPKIIAAIQEWAAEHGRPPTAGDWKSKDPDGKRPTSAAVWTTMGWADAIEEAGFPRPVGGGGGPRKKSQFDASGSGASDEAEKTEAVTASEGEPTLGPPGPASRAPVPAVTEAASPSETTLVVITEPDEEIELVGDDQPTFAEIAAELAEAYHAAEAANIRLGEAAAGFRAHGLPLIVAVENNWGYSLTEADE